MTNIVFNQAKLRIFQGSLDLSSGNFYVHLVTVEPTNADLLTIAQVTTAAGGTYEPKAVTGMELVLTGNTVNWRFSSPSWTALSTNNSGTVKGLLVCKQSAGAPLITDSVICYCSLDTPYTPNGSNFIVQIPANGVLNGV